MLDLHHFKIHDAWQEFNNFINNSYYNGKKTVKVITGKGLILSEFNVWIELHSRIREGNLNKDGGSWTIKLKKSE